MNIIKIKLTPEQLEQLQPLFDEVEKHPHEGMVLGQVYQGGILSEYAGTAIFAWMPPKEVINRANKALRKAKQRASRIIEPADWTPIPGTDHFEEAW